MNSFFPILLLIYFGVLTFILYLAWRFVEAFVSVARSLKDIAATYRTTSTSPPPGGQDVVR